MSLAWGMLIGLLIVFAAMDGHVVAVWLLIAAALYAIFWIASWLRCLFYMDEGNQ